MSPTPSVQGPTPGDLPFELTVSLRGLDEARGRLAGFDARLQAALLGAMRRAALAVEARAKELVSGEVLHVRTGTLQRSIESRAEPLPGGARGIISASARYARIHELGGVIHLPEILPRRARALRFMVGGNVVFAARVRAHDVRMPERPYLRRALQENRAQIRAEVLQAVREAAGKGGGGGAAAAVAA
jgi:phage gpG-like protein